MNLKHCIGQKFNVNVVKATHRTSNFLKTLVSQEIFAIIDLRKNFGCGKFLHIILPMLECGIREFGVGYY